MQVISEQRNLRVSYNEEKNILICEWIGYQQVDDIKDGCELITAHVKKYGTTYLINDLVALKGTFTAANDWINNEWLPKAIASGLACTAYVYSPDVFAKFALSDLFKKRDADAVKGYDYNAFDTFDDAMDWLLKKQLTKV